MEGARTRLGVYVDTVYSMTGRDGKTLSTDRAFMLFAAEVAGELDRFVVFGRAVRADEPADHELPAGTEIVELPAYPNLTQLGAVLRALPGTVWAMWRGLARVDIIWVFGPHPLSLLLVALATLRRRRVVLGVRQDTLPYYRSRLPSGSWKPALAVTWLLDRAYRLLARRVCVTIVGEDAARAYGLGRRTVLPMTVTLVRAADVLAKIPKRDWSGELELLTVGRLEQEKNPLLLINVLAELERREPGRYRLTWVGRGPLESTFAEQAAAAGLDSRIELAGYVPFGEELLSRYRDAHMFIHVSLTEGVPQVLIEAFASGLPIVATDVGGVARTVEHGEAGLLVPPADRDSLVDAVTRLADGAELRDRLALRGLELARNLALEAEAARVRDFVISRRRAL